MQQVKSNTFKKINYQIFLEMPKYMYKRNTMFNFHVIHKKTPKLNTTTCKFLFFFKRFEKMQKVKSNTFKKINYQIFLEMPKDMYKRNTIFNFHVIDKKTPKLKNNT